MKETYLISFFASLNDGFTGSCEEYPLGYAESEQNAKDWIEEHQNDSQYQEGILKYYPIGKLQPKPKQSYEEFLREFMAS